METSASKQYVMNSTDYEQVMKIMLDDNFRGQLSQDERDQIHQRYPGIFFAILAMKKGPLDSAEDYAYEVSISEMSKVFAALMPYWEADADLGNYIRALIEYKLKMTDEDDAERAELTEIQNQYFLPSGRPRTRMLFIQDKKSNPPKVLIVAGLKSNLIIADLKSGEYDELLIPVLRYASGMSRGMYVSWLDEKDTYCGTFYYFDISSEFLLYSKTNLVAMNKSHALYLLTGKISKIRFLTEEENEAYAKGDYSNLSFDEDGIYRRTGRFLGFNPRNLHAAEDHLDQDICEAAKDKYDCVILLRMFGKSRMVSEVLDTRRREISFDNIYTA